MLRMPYYVHGVVSSGGGEREIAEDLRINRSIRSRTVRLIDAEGEQLGVVSLDEALNAAEDAGLDLVEVAPNANPTVCRIMDYGKYKYEQSKRAKEARKRSRTVEVKELKMSPNIDDHDFDVRVRNAERFLGNGDKVKVTVQFWGREIVHSDRGRKVLDRFAQRLDGKAKIEQLPRMEGRSMIMLLGPEKEKE